MEFQILEADYAVWNEDAFRMFIIPIEDSFGSQELDQQVCHQDQRLSLNMG
jgi:hypothetical protein